MPWSTEATAIMRRIVSASNVDILMFNAPIQRNRDYRLLKKVVSRNRKPNVLMILVTSGGDPDAAYRISRCLQNHYEKFTVCIPGICKSAGTLIALGANELAFTENGELGPLDIQLAKKDDLWDQESGLTVMTALTALHENAQDAFDHFLVSLTTRSGGRITVKTASEIAAKLTEAIYAPVSEQIDPIHMGEVSRSMAIAQHYGRRLVERGKNFDEEKLKSLISDYPSHGFVIDQEEAGNIFKRVRACTADELALIEELGSTAVAPSDTAWVKFISDDIVEEDAANAAEEARRILEQSQAGGVDAPPEGHVPPNGQAGHATPPA